MRRLSFVVLACCLACGGEDEPVPSGDAGVDAGVGDAASDVSDAASDSGTDGASGAPPGCGDGVVDSFETCDPPGSCPTACEPVGACFDAVLVGAAEWCTAT